MEKNNYICPYCYLPMRFRFSGLLNGVLICVSCDIHIDVLYFKESLEYVKLVEDIIGK